MLTGSAAVVVAELPLALRQGIRHVTGENWGALGEAAEGAVTGAGTGSRLCRCCYPCHRPWAGWARW